MPMLKTAVSLAVAAVPEGLPTVATTTLALGMRKLRDQNVLVRKLGAVETLGALQVVCMDKTGTITQNRMELVSVFVGMERFEVSAGVIHRHGQMIDPLTVGELVRLFEMTSLCSEVELDSIEGEVVLRGTPTESALVQTAVEIGVDVPALRRRHPLHRSRPRSEQRNFMDTLHTDEERNEPLLVVKGTPVEVLPLCKHILEDGTVRALEEKDLERIRLENERMAGQALRVLAVAYSKDTGVPEQRRNLIWIGLAGIADPARPGMAILMSEFHRAGVHTVMITGDQSATATAIAKEIELNPSGRLQSLDAARLETMAPEVLSSLAKRVDIFSRVSPAQKLQIVKALQASGQVVAMTGDGVNDGPALRAADIGIAMGRSGSEVAQEVAAIVVSDDELTTIITSIEQGRTIYDDIKKAVHFILSSNTSEILMTVTATVAGLGQPLNPMQLLWINLVSDVFPELALGVEPPEPEVLHRPPRDPLAPMFAREDLRKILFEGTLITGGAMSAYLWGLLRYGGGVHASTIGFTSLTTAQLLHAITCRSEPHSIFDEIPLPRNPYIPLSVGGGLAVTGLATLVPSLRRTLGVTRLGLIDWLIAGVTAVAPLFTNELLKVVRRNRLQEHENLLALDLVEKNPRRQDDGQQE
jgi:Ca2+-transporting ATPase